MNDRDILNGPSFMADCAGFRSEQGRANGSFGGVEGGAVLRHVRFGQNVAVA